MQVNQVKKAGLAFTYFLLIFALLGVSIALGQTNQKETLTWGIKGGVTVSDFYGDAVSVSEVNTVFNGGVFLNYRFNDYWALQPEVIFSEKGAELDTGLTGEDGSAQYDLHYLTVPVLAKFYIPTGSFVTPNIYAGPQIAFNLYGESNDVELNDALKTVAFVLAFVAGDDFDVAFSFADFV